MIENVLETKNCNLEKAIEMGLSKGIIRLSVGIDDNIEASFEKMKNCMIELRILK